MRPLAGIRAAFVGGDAREVEIVRAALLAGMVVTTYGLARGRRPVAATAADTVIGAVAGARFVVAPIPGLSQAGEVYAPSAPAPLRLIDVVSAMANDSALILGTADAISRRVARERGVRVIEYEGDDELMFQRAPAVAEGALALLIGATDFTLHRSRAALVGFGRIGETLAQRLLALGVRLTVVCRSPVQRARAQALGAEAEPLEALARLAPDLDLIVNTVPAPLVTASVIAGLPERAVLLDLAAPPGGIDPVAGGGRVIWGRGLGARAPVTVGQSQWQGIRRRMEADLEAMAVGG